MSNNRSWLAIAVPLICAFEGCDYVAHHQYFDPPGVITYCYGQTNYDNPNIKSGTRFTKQQCDTYAVPTIEKYNAQMHKCIPAQQPPNREAALTSATYNLGQGNICKSKIAYYINRGDIADGCRDLKSYVRANHKVLPGLVKRREAEYQLCMRND